MQRANLQINVGPSFIALFSYGLVLLSFSILALVHLGHYSLWDDESYTALAGKGVLLTGDTSAVIDKNIVALHDGLVLRSLKDRSTAPLSAYLAGLGMLCFGENAFGARIVFSLLGIGTFFMILVVSIRKSRDVNFPLILAIFLVGNAALILFIRQARYYSPGIFLITLLAILNINSLQTKIRPWLSVVVWFFLFLVNQLWALAAAVCLAYDICFWQSRNFKDKWKELLGPIFSGCISVGAVSFFWNPFLTLYGNHLSNNSIGQRLQLFYWNLRDFNSAELGSLPFLILALAVGLWKKDTNILRALTCFFIFLLIIASFSPQAVSVTNVADVRYLSPMIPFAAAVAAKTLCFILQNRLTVRFMLSALLALTTVYQGAPISMPLRSSLALLANEILSPPQEPYRVVIEWLQKNDIGSKSIFVVPGPMTYPLMFHVPGPIYAWQLSPEKKQEEQFKSLPDIHFKGLVPPDFIVVFGPSVEQIRQLIGQWSMQGLRYQEVARLMTFWKDLYRPELFWRSFKAIEKFDPSTEAIYIFQRQS